MCDEAIVLSSSKKVHSRWDISFQMTTKKRMFVRGAMTKGIARFCVTNCKGKKEEGKGENPSALESRRNEIYLDW